MPSYDDHTKRQLVLYGTMQRCYRSEVTDGHDECGRPVRQNYRLGRIREEITRGGECMGAPVLDMFQGIELSIDTPIDTYNDVARVAP